MNHTAASLPERPSARRTALRLQDRKFFRKIPAFLCSILCLISAQVAGASGLSFTAPVSISGRTVSAADGSPVGYATAALYRDSLLITGGTTDEDGFFKLHAEAAGRYRLEISFIGYRTVSLSVGTETDGPAIDLGEIRLEPDAEILASASVTARRPVIEQKIDKLVMNVADAVSTEGSNGADLLRKAPGVTIDFDGNVKLNGSAVEVWIDNRPAHLSGKDLEVLLQGTDATTIDRIEIMAHPSAKYDAAGSGGILNIVTKKNFLAGFNGSASVNYGGMQFNRYNQTGGGSLNLNYRGRKTNTFLTFSGGYDATNILFSSLSRYGSRFENTQYAESEMISENTRQSFRAGNDWYLNDRNILGVIVNGSWNDGSTDAPEGNFTEYRTDGELTARTESEIRNPSRHRNLSANLNYTHTFDPAKMHELTVNADYSWFDIRNGSFQEDLAVDPVTGVRLPVPPVSYRQDAAQRMDIWSAKADYQRLFWQTGMLEAGAKWARTLTDNNTLREDLTDGSWLPNPDWSNRFGYDEQIAALYASAAKSFGPKWSLKIGLRGEYTYAAGDWRSAGEKTVKSYFDLFPTVFASYLPNGKWRLSLTYTSRINRPHYSQLNPYRMNFGTNSVIEGNPDLNPQYADQGMFTVGYGQHLNLMLMYQHNRNLIMQRPYVDPVSGNQLLRWENFGTQQLAGASFSVSELPVCKWLSVNANYFIAYNANRSSDASYRSASLMQNFYGNLTFLLPQDWKIEFGGFGMGNMDIGYLRMKPMYQFFAGVKKNFWENRATLALNVNDLFRTMRMDLESSTGDVITYSMQHIANMQKVSISFSYRFGQGKASRYRKVGNLEEAARASGSGNTLGSTGKTGMP